MKCTTLDASTCACVACLCVGACMCVCIDTITLPGLEKEVAVTDISVSRDVICHTTVMLFSST